jgi:hypothetical protein
VSFSINGKEVTEQETKEFVTAGTIDQKPWWQSEFQSPRNVCLARKYLTAPLRL